MEAFIRDTVNAAAAAAGFPPLGDSETLMAFLIVVAALALVFGIVIGRIAARRRSTAAETMATPLLTSRHAGEAVSESVAVPYGTYQHFLTERGVPQPEIRNRLNEYLEQFDAVRAGLDGLGEGPETPFAFGEVREILEAGAFARAADLLTSLGEDHARIGRDLKSVADQRLMAAASVRVLIGDLLSAQGAHDGAAKHYQDAIDTLPPDEDTIRCDYLNKHGTASYNAAKFNAAADSFAKALSLRERLFDAHDPRIGTTLNNLAMVHYAQGNYEAAEPLYKKALIVDERNYGGDHPAIATDLNNLALLHKKQGNILAAEPLLKRALIIKEKSLPSRDPSLIRGMRNYASVLRALKRTEEADKLELRANALATNDAPPIAREKGDTEDALPVSA